jgi:VWFA-related protein
VEEELYECFHLKPSPVGLVDWKIDDEGESRFLNDVLVDRRREDRTLTALEGLVAFLGHMRDARTVLLPITDGWRLFRPDQAVADQAGVVPSGPPPVTVMGGRLGVGRSPASSAGQDRSACNSELLRLANLDDRQRLHDLIETSIRSNVAVYPVRPSGLDATDQPLMEVGSVQASMAKAGNRVATLRTLADDTGGIAVVNTNDLAGGLRRIVDDVSAYYLLGYYSTNPKTDGKYRKIQVKTTRPGLTVSARQGYYAPAADARPEAAPASGPKAPTTPSAVGEAIGALARLRPTADLYTSGAVAFGQLAIAVEIAEGRLAGGQWAQGGDVRIEVTDAAGNPAGLGRGRIDPGTRGVLVRLPASGSGPWRVDASVQGPDGTLEDRASVAPASGTLLANPTLYRGSPAASSPLRAVADGLYRRSERVHVEWTELQALDQRTARLLDRRGQPLPVPVHVTERPLDGHTVLAADLNLAPLAAGDYVIEVTAGSGSTTERRVVAVRVTQ